MKNKPEFPNRKGPINRRSALQLGATILLLGVQHIARGASIVAVRVWQWTLKGLI